MVVGNQTGLMTLPNVNDNVGYKKLNVYNN